MQNRIAVDSTAESYWETYFGPYGKQWVRKIPRRVATALLQRSAGLKPGEAATAAEGATVIPLMPRPVITANRVHIEGAVDFANGSRRLFSAEFDHDGRLLALDHIPAPAAA